MPRSHQVSKWPSKAHLHFPVCEKASGARAAPPEGKLSVSGSSSPPPSHAPPWACHMASGKSGACGGVSPGRLCREAWELHPVGGGGGGAHVQMHARAHTCTLWLSRALSLAVALSLQLLQRHVSCWSVPPDWGLTQRSLHS